MIMIDLLIIFAYLVAMLAIGAIVSKKETLNGFLVGDRKVRTSFLIFSVVSTNVGAGSIVALSAAAYDTGISYALTAAIGILTGWLLVALFAPKIKNFGDESRAHTLGDFFGSKYSDKNRVLVSLIILISYFFWTALQFVAIAGILHVMMDIDFNIALISSALIVVAYTTMGGIKADIYTDVFQFWIIFIALFLVLFPLGLTSIGGLGGFEVLPSKYFNPFSFGGPAFFFGGIIFGFPLMLVSMEVWQRVYASVDSKSARKVFLASALINAPLLIFPAFLGMIAAITLPGLDRNLALFYLMKQILPTGLLGLGFAGVLAALMSTVDSMIMVGSATVLKDFYINFFNPKVTDRQALNLVRLFTLFFGLLCLSVAFFIPDVISLQLIGAFVLLIFAPAVIGGLTWKRANSKASFWSILSGFIMTIIALPLMPTVAFIPGVLVSLIVFVVLAFLTSKPKG